MTILLTVFGQLAIKLQLRDQNLPLNFSSKFWFLFSQLLNPWVFAGCAAAFIAGLFWMAAMTKLPISRAYPLMSLAFVGVAVCSAIFLNEPFSTTKIIGILLLIPSLALITR